MVRANWVEKAIAAFPERSIRAYLFAAACIAFAAMLRPPLALGANVPFVTFYPAITVIALIAGVRPAVVSAVAAVILNLSPLELPDLRDAPLDYLAKCAVFLIGSTFIISAIGAYRDALASYKTHEAQRDLLIRELQHRSRNAYSVVQAIVRSTLKGQDEIADTIIGRVHAISRTNDLIYDTDSHAVSLRHLLTEEFRAYGDRVRLSGEDVSLLADPARNLALVIHEFTTNAVKHGALSVHSGSVQITWTVSGRNIQMKWKEIGGPPAKDPERTGFGSNLVDLSVRAMGGTHVDSFSEYGFESDLSFVNGTRS